MRRHIALAACALLAASCTSTPSQGASPTLSPEDIEPGSEVTDANLAKLFPPWKRPTPPETLTEQTDEAALDAAEYYNLMTQYAFRTRDTGISDEITTKHCYNCSLGGCQEVCV
ncbi:hypothetical protein BSZ39_07325 [Bowdeniella nasicola]|uniref:DUF6318 domain-containing protein n=1 Tax=Bowdeniella nasicola TaxID=208480 RepID=A0A1Q5Q1U9_9ACTO|nr:DUF6318 family protein [Bowdeniella nasicola]OKL53853.1 hypothetical protein BSZ39_07325 [Bowdeniella nasicola]